MSERGKATEFNVLKASRGEPAWSRQDYTSERDAELDTITADKQARLRRNADIKEADVILDGLIAVSDHFDSLAEEFRNEHNRRLALEQALAEWIAARDTLTADHGFTEDTTSERMLNVLEPLVRRCQAAESAARSLLSGGAEE